MKIYFANILLRFFANIHLTKKSQTLTLGKEKLFITHSFEKGAQYMLVELIKGRHERIKVL